MINNRETACVLVNQFKKFIALIVSFVTNPATLAIVLSYSKDRKFSISFKNRLTFQTPVHLHFDHKFQWIYFH